MTVHYRGTNGFGKPSDTAPCGHNFTDAAGPLASLAYSGTWDRHAPYPVDCLECLMHGPPKRKTLPWHGDGKRR